MTPQFRHRLPAFGQVLAAVFSAHPDQASTREFLIFLHRMAVVRLAMRLYPAGGALPRPCDSLDDLAYDCIAPLFERDDHGRFSRLRSAYASVDPATAPLEEFLAATRSMITGRIDLELACRLKDSDPSMNKVIRNVRNALASAKYACEVEHQSILWVSFGDSNEVSRKRPLMPAELLEWELAATTAVHDTIPSLLPTIAMIFTRQAMYRKAYPLVMLCTAIAKCTLSRQRMHESMPAGAGQHLTERTMYKCVAEVETRMWREFSRHGVSRPLYSLYIRTAADIMQEAAAGSPARHSHYEILRRHMPEVDRLQYLEHHRRHIERLVHAIRRACYQMTGMDAISTVHRSTDNPAQ